MSKKENKKMKNVNKPKKPSRVERLFGGVIKQSFDKANYINYTLISLMQKDCQVKCFDIDDYVAYIRDLTQDLSKDGIDDFDFKKVYNLDYSFDEFIEKVYSLESDIN